MSEEILSVTAEDITDSVAVLTVRGEIDRDSRDLLDTAAQEALRPGCDGLVIDLSGVTFCDSGALSLLVRLHRKAAVRGGSLRLVAAPGPVLTALTITNLDRMLDLHSTVDDAVRAVRG